MTNGDIIAASYVEGVFHGPWTFDLINARFSTLHYEDGRMHGPWDRRDDDRYSKTGTVEDDRFEGTFTVIWPDGVEMLVPYESGVTHGKMTVTRDGRPLGTLVCWKGKHVDGILTLELHFPDYPRALGVHSPGSGVHDCDRAGHAPLVGPRHLDAVGDLLVMAFPELIAFPVLDVGRRRPDARFPLQPDPASTGQEGQNDKEGPPDSP